MPQTTTLLDYYRNLPPTEVHHRFVIEVRNQLNIGPNAEKYRKVEIMATPEVREVNGEWHYVIRDKTGAEIMVYKATDQAEAAKLASENPTPAPKEKIDMSALPESDLWNLVDGVLKHSRRVLLLGPPGTGKTYAATRLGKHSEDQPVYSVTMTPETPAAELRGHFIPSGDEFKWMDGPAISAWKSGGRLVINEIDHSSPDCLSLLFAVLDDPEFAALTLPNGETVHPTENFQVVATMNGEPDDLPPALQDRFPVTLEIDEVNPEALAALPEDLRYVARNTALHKTEDRKISIRLWMEFANLRVRMVNAYGKREGLEMAAKAVFGPRASEALNALEIANDMES